jgi:hypothetical protein
MATGYMNSELRGPSFGNRGNLKRSTPSEEKDPCSVAEPGNYRLKTMTLRLSEFAVLVSPLYLNTQLARARYIVVGEHLLRDFTPLRMLLQTLYWGLTNVQNLAFRFWHVAADQESWSLNRLKWGPRNLSRDTPFYLTTEPIYSVGWHAETAIHPLF